MLTLVPAPEPCEPYRFFRATALWACGLVAIVFGTWLLAALPPGGDWSVWRGVHLLAMWFGLFLPFAAFAGGLAVSRTIPNRAVALRAGLIATISFGLLAYGKPIADFHDGENRGVDVSRQFPLGSQTPGTILSLRATIQAAPPSTHSYSVDRPLEWPPNWLTYLLHGLFALPVYSLFAAFLGREVRFLTTGLSPPARINARWALGLLTGVAFFAALAVGGEWVRMNPSHSGIVGAWGPMLVPLLELGLLAWLGRLRGSRQTPILPVGIQ